MNRTAAMIVALLCACDAGEKKPAEIKNGIQLTYSLAEGSPAAAAAVMQKRLDGAKVSGRARAENGQIVVDLAAADQEVLYNVRELISRTGRLELKVVDDGTEIMRQLATIANGEERELGITGQADRWMTEGGETHDDVYLSASDRTETLSIEEAKKRGCFRGPAAGNANTVCEVTGREQLQRFVVDTALLHNVTVPDDHAFVYERVTPTEDRPVPPYWRSYYVKRASQIAPDAIAAAAPAVDPVSNRPVISVTLTPGAAKAFGELTRANVGRKLAVLLDGRVASAPIVAGAITGGKVTITMGPDSRPGEVAQLAGALASGPLPAPVVLETIFELKDGKVIAPPAE